MKLFLLLFLVSCALVPVRKDPRLQPYVEMFEVYSGLKVDMPVVFGQLKEPVVGICYGFRTPWIFRTVVIDRDYFMSVPNCIKKFVILHELAHCVLDKDHIRMLRIHGFYEPMSVMNPTVDWRFCDFEAYYIEKLFRKL